jgi:predicted phage terminase large subunit-like protein
MDRVAAAALREKARREQARRSLLAFCKYVMPAYPVRAGHLQLLTEKLEQVERYVATLGQEGIGRLMVFMPPRYWKSQTSSVLFPAWFLGRNPDKRVIETSYAGELAFNFSRRVRNTVQSEDYARIFGHLSAVEDPLELARDSRSAKAWDLAGLSGGLAAAGVGGGITGKGAHLLIIDDPVKDREQAESETYRELAWEWYGSTAYTRLEDAGAIILIMTRWHVDDLAGRLLRQMADEPGSEAWQVVLLAARAEGYSAEERAREPWLPEQDLLGREEGQPLWPEKHDLEELQTIEVAVGPYNWPSLYQQRPRAREGAMFQRGWFGYVDQAPEGLQWVRYWDLAQVSDEEAKKKRKDPSYTCSAAVAMDADGTVYVRDMVRGRWEWPEGREVVKATIQIDKNCVHGIELKLHGKTAVQELLRSRELAGSAFKAVNVEGGAKEVRALALQTRAHAGRVVLVRSAPVRQRLVEWMAAGGREAMQRGFVGGPWLEPFLAEITDFPSGKHDDQVDSVVGGLQMLDAVRRQRPARSYQG